MLCKSFTQRATTASRCIWESIRCWRISRLRSLFAGAACVARKYTDPVVPGATVAERRSFMKEFTSSSPCLTCPRGMDIRSCEDKRCPVWRKWFLSRWDRIHRYPRLVMERSEPVPVGVILGGRHYAAPHQVKAYLQNDPCNGCSCPGELCSTPCRVRKAWDHAREAIQ